MSIVNCQGDNVSMRSDPGKKTEVLKHVDRRRHTVGKHEEI